MEQIRRMRGGAQSHLMRCSDGKDHDIYCVVKFQNNPQHSRVLVNELLGNRIARRMGLPVPRVEIVKVEADLIRWTPALCIEMPRSSTPCCPGLRLIEEEEEYSHLRRLHPRLDEESLRGLRDHLESRFGAALRSNGSGGPVRNAPGNPKPDTTDWFSILEKWDATLSQSLQLADSKATIADDINAEIDRLYNERVAVGQAYTLARPNRPSARDQMRNYMDQVFRQANLWNRIQKNVHVSDYSLDKDPLRIDYGYLRNGSTRGFVQTISLSTKLDDGKVFAYTAKKIQAKASDAKIGFSPEFVAVTDVVFNLENENHVFLKEMFGSTGIEQVPLDNAAVWVAKLRPMLQ